MKISTYNKIIKFLEERRTKKLKKLLEQIRENARIFYLERIKEGGE